MTDAQVIDDAYQFALRDLYNVLVRAYATAKSPAERSAANSRFETGVKLAREARDQAKKLL